MGAKKGSRPEWHFRFGGKDLRRPPKFSVRGPVTARARENDYFLAARFFCVRCVSQLETEIALVLLREPSFA